MDKVTIDWWIKHANFLEEERNKWRRRAKKAERRVKELESELNRVEQAYSQHF